MPTVARAGCADGAGTGTRGRPHRRRPGHRVRPGDRPAVGGTQRRAQHVLRLDDGLVLDLSGLRTLDIDVAGRTAWAGLTAADYTTATATGQPGGWRDRSCTAP